jgi:RNA polymerase sigma-70 factor (ECF subfamily)
MGNVMALEPNDQELLRRARAGDRHAYGELASRYRTRLEALAFSLMTPVLRRAHPVEDIVQETLTRGLEAIGSFEWKGSESFLRWLGAIARNIIVQAVRREPLAAKPGLKLDAPAPGVSPSRRLRRQERQGRLDGALAALTPEQREVIRLSRLEGLKIREIAQRTGRSEDAVKQLLARGLRGLRRRMGDTESFHLPREEGSDAEADPPPGRSPREEGT